MWSFKRRCEENEKKKLILKRRGKIDFFHERIKTNQILINYIYKEKKGKKHVTMPFIYNDLS